MGGLRASRRRSRQGVDRGILAPIGFGRLGQKQMEPDAKTCCGWVTQDELYIAYHDGEWGVPVHHDVKWFELLSLEGAQAGLSWITILKRREAYREVFDGFDPARVAQYDRS